MTRIHLLVFALISLAMPVGLASAQVRVTVLGFVSEDGDEGLARSLKDSLREEAADHSAWDVADVSPSFDQLTMIHDCDPRQQGCMVRIAAEVDTDMVIYGVLARDAEDRVVQVHAWLMRVSDGQILGTGKVSVPVSEVDEPAYVHAGNLVAMLTGAEDRPAEPAPVKAQPTQIEPEQDFDLDREPEGSGSLDWLGYTLVGVAAVSTGLAIMSWTQINSASSDPALESYRRAIGRRGDPVTDACDETETLDPYSLSDAEFNAAVDACSKGQTHEILQYVFLGTAVAAGATGVVLLLTSGNDDPGTAGGKSGFALRPKVGLDRASLEAKFRF